MVRGATPPSRQSRRRWPATTAPSTCSRSNARMFRVCCRSSRCTSRAAWMMNVRCSEGRSGFKGRGLVERRWPGLFFQNVGSGCVTDRRVSSTAHSHRRRFPSRSGLEPLGPIRPPAAVMLLRASQPRLRRLERRPIGLVRPMAPFTFGRWVDHPGECPLAASTKRVFALVSCAIRHAERQGTMWSFSAPIA